MLTAWLLAAVAIAIGATGLRRGSGRARLARITSREWEADVGSPRARTGRASLRSARFVVGPAIGFAVFAGLGGVLGTTTAVVLGAVAAFGSVVVLDREPPITTASVEEVALVVELFAGCLDAGLSPLDALEAAIRPARDPAIVRAGGSTVAALRRGDSAEQAWQHWYDDPALAAVGRVAARGSSTGAAVAEDLRRCAARLRARRRTAVRRKVQRVSVLVAAPLGLCFLPAFVCVAVVPTVVGLFPSFR